MSGLSHVVVSPGSRNAPIVAGFIRVGGFELLSAPDERTAAYMALGSALATGRAAAVICTSGTATLNLYPGICESFYQQVPLIAITADRPGYMIDRWDGQTIRQKNLYHPHILASLQPENDLHSVSAFQEITEIAFKAWETANAPAKGPVHINIPLEEPIYDGLNAPLTLAPLQRDNTEPEQPSAAEIPAALSEARKPLVLAGQMSPNRMLNDILMKLSYKIPVMADVLANVSGGHILNGTEDKNRFNYQEPPDVLITTGMSVVSKTLKNWLRNNKPKHHFHISAGGFTGDPFFTLPQTIHTSPEEFFSSLLNMYNAENFSTSAPGTENQLTGEAGIVQCLMETAGADTAIHLGNSMTIRYANRIFSPTGLRYGNRGTSGIDGSLSTAAGFAWAEPAKNVLCITGDIGFLYDKNAFWCTPLPENLKVAVLNNAGGIIFDIIQGPSELPSLRPYINTPHQLKIISIAEHYQIDYLHMSSADIDPQKINQWLRTEGTSILEITTS